MQEKNIENFSVNHTYKFFITGNWWKEKTFPSLNDYLTEIGRHPVAGGKMKSKYMNITISSIRKHLRGVKIIKPVIIHYKFFEPNKGRKRDVMNVFSLCDKFVEDALVKCGVLVDDNPSYVVNTTHDFYYTDKEPYIEIILEEIDNV